MVESPISVADAFSQCASRPAVFDRNLRERLGLWHLREPVPVKEIVMDFYNRPQFKQESSNVFIPVHRKESAELTGEYLTYIPESEQLEYYNSATKQYERITIDICKTLYPAWRLRFWHENYSTPNEQPLTIEEKGITVTSPSSTSSSKKESAVSPDLFEDLRAFLERQKEAERQEVRHQFSQQSPERFFDNHPGIPHAVSKGREIDNYGQQMVVVQVVTDSKSGKDDIAVPETFAIHTDMEVIIDSPTADGGFPVEAKVLEISEGEIKLGVYWDRAEDKGAAEAAFGSDAETHLQIAGLLNPSTFDRECEAIAQIEDDDEKRALLLGNRSPEFDEGQSLPINEAKLDRYQTAAAKTALRAEDVYCIHGPPGTGKTRTLTEIIRAAVKANWRVLACAHSNRAVDNLLVGSSTPDRVDPSSLHASAQKDELTIARAGGNSKHPVVQKKYMGNDFWKSDVVGATTSATHRFMDNDFDLVVVDEASQASIPSTLLPYSKGRRLILAGDHKQLPPYYSEEQSDEEAMEASLFEHLMGIYKGEASSMLRCQYRMHQAIAEFPNETFYEGKLSHGEENRDRTLGSFEPFEAIHVKGEEQQTPTHSYYNELEAKAVARQVANLLFGGIQPSRIGVITPYASQIGKIRGRLQDLTQLDENVEEVKVATVDSFQGGEKDAIIVSFVRSNSEGFSGFLTFPNEGPRRLNVALTRAKRRLVLVGNWEALTTRAPNRAADESAVQVYQSLYSHLQERDLISQFPHHSE